MVRKVLPGLLVDNLFYVNLRPAVIPDSDRDQWLSVTSCRVCPGLGGSLATAREWPSGGAAALSERPRPPFEGGHLANRVAGC